MFPVAYPRVMVNRWLLLLAAKTDVARGVSRLLGAHEEAKASPLTALRQQGENDFDAALIPDVRVRSWPQIPSCNNSRTGPSLFEVQLECDAVPNSVPTKGEMVV